MIFTENKHLGDWLKGEVEVPKEFCRDSITVLAGESLTTGTVLGKITSSGKYVQLDLSASDGSQTAAGILITDSIEGDTVADAAAVALVRGNAVVSDNGLIWPSGATDNQKAAALVTLKTLGIIAREGV